MTMNVSPLVHIEIAVRDAEKAYQFLHDAFGAELVQEEFASFLDGEAARVIHVGLGDVVLQFIQPLNKDGSWYEQLRDKGPGVHNLTFTADDMDQVLAALDREGVAPKFSFPLDWASFLGAENVKHDPHPVYMLDTMDRIGFHLEMTESPLREPVAGPPASKYVTGRDELVGRVSPLLHIELTVPDVDETCRFLHAVFGSQRVEEQFAGFLDSQFMRVVHVNLSNVVLQYCQPLVKQGSWYEQLRDKGPGVHNITFIVDNIVQTMAAIERAGANDLFTFQLNWGELIGEDNVRPDMQPVHMVDTMELLGFHLELAERPTLGEVDFLYTDYR